MLYVFLLSRAFSTNSRARLEAIRVCFRKGHDSTSQGGSRRATRLQIHTLSPQILTASRDRVGYADNSYDVPYSSSLDAEYRTGWRLIENHERGERELTVHRLHLSLGQDPAFERMTHVFRETRST